MPKPAPSQRAQTPEQKRQAGARQPHHAKRGTGIIQRSRAELVAQETARRELEDRLAQSRRLEAVGRLAAGVAHDFNNVLTVIFAHAEELRRHADPQVGSAARDTLDAAERAANLTRQLLAYGRRQVLEPRVIDINVLLRDSETLFARLLGEDVRLTWDLGPGAVIVRAFSFSSL